MKQSSFFSKTVIQQISLLLMIGLVLTGCSSKSKKTDSDSADQPRPRVIVSSDIGGTDPDDFQSMIHYLMYTDRFQTEGLIASPYGKGRKEDIFDIIDLYEKDYGALSAHGDFPEPEYLRSVTKQGAEEAAPAKGWNNATEGSEWIIERAMAESDQPLWILVWGGLEDLAQALHDAPEIEKKIRVYWIGGPNKKWAVHPYVYIARNFPDLWMIEANSTYRGWFIDDDSDPDLKNTAFYENHIKGNGALGTDFGNYYKGSVKMGDTPSVGYLLTGDPDDPTGESWGGSFEKLPYSAYRAYERHTNVSDTIPTYSVIEWLFSSDEPEKGEEESFIWMEIDGQRIDGFYAGNGKFHVRFVPKRIGNWEYEVNSSAGDLQGETGQFVSANPWPGPANPQNFPLNNWWSDLTDPEFYLGEYQGAKSVSKWREEYLTDWSQRLSWIAE
jgi:hypothetical protein